MNTYEVENNIRVLMLEVAGWSPLFRNQFPTGVKQIEEHLCNALKHAIRINSLMEIYKPKEQP